MPDACRERRFQLAVERVGGLLAQLDRAGAPRLELAQRRDHVVGARLDGVDDRAGPAVRVRPVEQEHVREAVDRQAVIGLRHAGPLLIERLAAASQGYSREIDEEVGIDGVGWIAGVY